jgi:hypothetical protein
VTKAAAWRGGVAVSDPLGTVENRWHMVQAVVECRGILILHIEAVRPPFPVRTAGVRQRRHSGPVHLAGEWVHFTGSA